MKKLQIISLIVLGSTLIVFIIGRFVIPFPDELVRITGMTMLASIITTMFSTIKTRTAKK